MKDYVNALENVLHVDVHAKRSKANAQQHVDVIKIFALINNPPVNDFSQGLLLCVPTGSVNFVLPVCLEFNNYLHALHIL